MNEKRFELLLPNAVINDTIVRKSYYLSEKEDVEKVVDLLNEQQATITHLEKVNGKNFAKRRLLEQDNLVLRNENEQLRKELKRICNLECENCKEEWCEKK